VSPVKTVIFTFLIVINLGFTSCTTIPYERKSKVEEKLERLKLEQSQVIAKEIDRVSNQKDEVISAQENQMQVATNSLYGADLAFEYYIDPTRLDIIVNNRVKEAQTALGLKPTYDAIVRETERLRNELDETKTSMEQLRRNHQQAIEENKKIADEKIKQQQLVIQMQNELEKTRREFDARINEKQDELNALNNKIIALERKRADETASRERLLKKLMMICGALALLCLIGAIYSPVEKRTLGLLAMILGGITVAIPFIQPWMILTAGGIILAAIVAKILYGLNISKKANTSLVNAIQDTREKEPDVYQRTIKPSLKEWNTKYIKKSNGEFVKETDNDIEKHISEILAENNRI
jgi:hypothetical protein